MLLRAYRRFIWLLDKFCFTVYIRKLEIVGKENVPLEGPLIVASNHLNNADPPAIVLAMPRRPTFMAKKEMIGWPVLGLAFRLYGAFPVDRDGADLRAVRTATQVVNDGEMLVMFPEGTRSRTGSMKEAHPGTGLVALRTGAPIVPVAITGTEDIPFPWIFLKPLSVRHVKVVVGKPFTLPAVQKIDSEAAGDATAVIMAKIAELLPPEYQGVYAPGAASGATAKPVEAT
jgi:1-acyl-sn-glycerol-3-phosphate acyltransferase